MKYKSSSMYFCVIALLCLLQIYYLPAMNHVQAMIVASDFNKDRGDSDFLELLFEKDYQMLVSDHEKYPYFKGKGTNLYLNCVSDTKINGRKILMVDDKPVSFVIYFIAHGNNVNHLQDGDGIMPLMGVSHVFRRCGYGAMTMQYVISWFKEQQCQQAWLSVNKNNSNAQALYKKCGFVHTGKTSWGESFWWVLPLSQGYKMVYMAKKDQLTDINFSFK